MDDVSKDVLEKTYRGCKAVIQKHSEKLLLTACGGPAPPPQLSETRDEAIKRITDLVLGMPNDEIAMQTLKSRGPSIHPPFGIDAFMFFDPGKTGYEKGKLTPIVITKHVPPSPITLLEDGSIFIPLEHTIEEGEAIMNSLTRKK